jgi:hypothetical protein
MWWKDKKVWGLVTRDASGTLGGSAPFLFEVFHSFFRTVRKLHSCQAIVEREWCTEVSLHVLCGL